MLYPTHSVAMVLSITGARMTSVSCLGYVDNHDDGVFCEKTSLWRNPLSNQSALFRSSDGGMVRINEFRRVGQSGGRSVRLSLYGTEGSFEEQSNGAIWASRTHPPREVEEEVRCQDHSLAQWETARVDPALQADFTAGFGEVHQKYRPRLPQSYHLLPNGHEGAHQFLTDDFVTAAVKGALPSCHVWDAARFNAPGIIAHESARREGELMQIPDWGAPPANER